MFPATLSNKLYVAVFIGHRYCPNISETQIEKTLEPLILSGVKYFYNGGMGDFDLKAARAVHNLKKLYPNIKNILVIPYKSFSVADRNIFDDVIYPFSNGELNNSNYRAAIPLRNQYMVDYSLCAVCHVTHLSKGAYKTLEYAKKQNLRIIEIK